MQKNSHYQTQWWAFLTITSYLYLFFCKFSNSVPNRSNNTSAYDNGNQRRKARKPR